MTIWHDETRTAQKLHICDWCLTRIEVGDNYRRYRWADGGDAGSCKMHLECHAAMIDSWDGHEDGINPGANPRGGSCGWCMDCEHCRAAKAREANERQQEAAAQEVARLHLAS